MNRHVVAGLFGLALAGCAQNRSAMPSRGPEAAPVGLTSFPSIHDTINRENPKVDSRSLRAQAAQIATRNGTGEPVRPPDFSEATAHAHPALERRALESASPALGKVAETSTSTPAPPTQFSLETTEATATPAAESAPQAVQEPVSGLPPVVAAPEPDPSSSAPAAVEQAASGGEPQSGTVDSASAPAPAPVDSVAPAEMESVPPIQLPPVSAPSDAPVPTGSDAAPAAEEPAVKPESDAVGAAPAAPPAMESAPSDAPPPSTSELPAAAEAPSEPAAPPSIPETSSANAVPPETLTLPPAPELPPAGGDTLAAPAPSEPTAPPADAAVGEPSAATSIPELPAATESSDPAAPKAGESTGAPPAAPSIPELPAAPAPSESTAPPAGAAADALPAAPSLPELPAVPTSTGPSDAPAQPETGAGASAGEPAEPAPLELPPMLPPAQEEPAASPPPVAEAAAGTGTAAVSKVDSEVKQTGADSAMIRSQIRPRNAQPAGEVAAKVGDEIISLHELRTAVQERLKGVDPNQPPSEQEIAMVAQAMLQELVERSIVVQEAKRELKDPKKLDRFLEEADAKWRSEELEPLLRRYAAANEYELKTKLKAGGVSLDQLREAYRKMFLSQGYMRAKIGPKLTVSLPEMRSYYQEHMKDFDRPALVVWREVVIEVDKCASRGEARSKADAVLARLRRNEDFAKVAAAESHGPNKTRGGAWETTPGGYGVEAVNLALNSLPIGQISQVIEGPSSYHVVRVERRRPAGPAPFSEVEVQNKIRNEIFNTKVRHETTVFMDRLRKQTVVTTMFDRPMSDPATVRTNLPR